MPTINNQESQVTVSQIFKSSFSFLLINYKNILLYLGIAGFVLFICDYILIKIFLGASISTNQILIDLQKILVEIQSTKEVSAENINYISSALLFYFSSLITAILASIPLLLKAIPSAYHNQPLVEFKQIATNFNHFFRLTKSFIAYFFYFMILLVLLGFVNSLVFTILLSVGNLVSLPIMIISNIYFVAALAITIFFLITSYRFSLLIPASLMDHKLTIFKIYQLSSKHKIDILIIIFINFIIYFVLSTLFEITNIISPMFNRYSDSILRLLIIIFYSLIQTKIFAKLQKNSQMINVSR